jgi:hypothetical protein
VHTEVAHSGQSLDAAYHGVHVSNCCGTGLCMMSLAAASVGWLDRGGRSTMSVSVSYPMRAWHMCNHHSPERAGVMHWTNRLSTDSMTCTQKYRPSRTTTSSWLMLCPHWSGTHVSRIGATSYVRTSTGERQCRLTHSLPEGNSAVSARCRSESHGRLPTKLRTCRCSKHGGTTGRVSSPCT